MGHSSVLESVNVSESRENLLLGAAFFEMRALAVRVLPAGRVLLAVRSLLSVSVSNLGWMG